MSKKYRYCKVFTGKTLLDKNNIIALNMHLKTMNKTYLNTGNTLLNEKVKVLVVSDWEVLCSTLCDPMDCNPPGSAVQRISQARILEWVAFSFSRFNLQSRDWTWVFCIAGRFFTIWVTREAQNKLRELQNHGLLKHIRELRNQRNSSEADSKKWVEIQWLSNEWINK